MVRLYLLLVSSIFLNSCVTYQHHINRAKTLVSQGAGAEAAALIEVKAKKPGNDQLVFLLEYAHALFLAKDYKKSIIYFLQAEQLADLTDYYSLSREAGSLIFNEGLLQYKIRPFEFIFINYFLALSYLMLDELDEAAVEARKINTLLSGLESKNRLKNGEAVLGLVISAVTWEANKNWDAAYIDYNKAYEFSKSEGLLIGLIKSAYFSKRMDAYNKLKSQYPELANTAISNKYANVFIFHHEGWVPQKTFSALEVSLPVYKSVHSQHRGYTPSLKKAIVSSKKKFSFDVDQVARATLQKRLARMYGKRLIGVGTKVVLTKEISKKDKGLGQAAWAIMNLSDRADVRQWSFLPKFVNINRIMVLPSAYTIDLPSGSLLSNSESNQFSAKKGQSNFHFVRSY